ncbi:TetR family transcriptional regulator [Actinoplanes sp. TBRC 11911]|uniref:TetR/AcrR family transcriptional regulator n=1 Tax=Actinoplanes sp. TBRC 11911 TaxID=2729386 RepID=UPI00145C6566|nr:TetR family transcriptional regulator [Actinoplanes sp. TBRC 11911]NMO56898.1 TetR family transcriptional regulator [Actinoplanes sp. TBRC 11911]
MPKKVDHHERRTLIADALMRVAAEQGLEAVSLRHVAAEAGVSAGMVQHYFRTKDEMMGFALSVVRERGQKRVGEAVARLGPDPAPRLLLRTFLAAVLPLDDAGREDGRVALAFLAYTAVRPATEPSLRTDTAQLVEFVAGLLPRGRNENAAGVLALMEGLGMYLLSGQYTQQQALAALDAHLDLLFSRQVSASDG